MLGTQLNSDESRGLLSAIDKMRELLHGERVTLPEIVVVGEQSVGKSSILEAISGIQLPRAQNICTRCPLELRMKTAQDKEYAIIRSSVGNTAERRIDDLTKIADAVAQLTSDIAGKGANVSSNPIYLTVYKHDTMYDLTLIDLPGITRNAIKGQAEDIHEQILKLIKKYIEPDTAIVLHVIPASIDFTTSETMKLAKVFDPSCQRQLIAASKIDKYDKGIAEKLQGRGSGSMELQLGCVAVLNRNQDEIDKDISFDEMKRQEKEFFIKYKEDFQHLPDEFKGSEQLVRRLATIQQERIRSTFPNIIKELRKKIAEKKARLKKIPASMNNETECWKSFQSMMNIYREDIQDNAKGEYHQVASMDIDEVPSTSADVIGDDMDPNVVQADESQEKEEDDSSITEGKDEDHIAYHVYHLQHTFQDECRNSFTDFLSSQYHKIVLREIDRATGISLPNFPNYQVVVGLFRKELHKMRRCCRKVVIGIHKYMSECLLRLFDKAFNSKYPRLKEHLKEMIIKRLAEVKDVLLERVKEILDTERRVFTLNHYYMDTVNKLKEEDKKKNDEPNRSATTTSSIFGSIPGMSGSAARNTIPTEPYTAVSNEAQSARKIQIALHAYSKVVEKRITDNIAQACYYHFITQCALKIDQHLSGSIPSSELVKYMREPAKQTNLRNKLIHSIQAYEEALQFGIVHM
ncbi:unnamed protein product [Adineta steineri]|uniref:Uncharacterized protein n=1 Tax=Adineta steineri TaxID=433720 RepID=A0A814WG10_9BILA|nr:unnamed protein product [Adineta steineri]CAF3569066.1 unnamed protein product [Adineta steineri]